MGGRAIEGMKEEMNERINYNVSSEKTIETQLNVEYFTLRLGTLQMDYLTYPLLIV